MFFIYLLISAGIILLVNFLGMMGNALFKWDEKNVTLNCYAVAVGVLMVILYNVQH